MSTNQSPDKARALRAEKQVERLERELEALRSRTKKVGTPTGSPVLRDSDRLNFQLQEQVKDLKHQLKHQHSEHSKLQDTLTTRTNEYEEKLKRMREIFGQASRNIDQYRATIASKNTEIEKLKAEFEECQVREHTYKSLSETHQLTNDKLNTQLTNEKAFYGSEIKQLEVRNRQLEGQLTQIKTDYEQYKKRAQSLLNKEQTDQSSSQLNELQELVEELQNQKMKYISEQQSTAENQRLLEHDLRKALDRIRELEKEHELSKKEFELNKQSVQDAFLVEKRSLESKLQSMAVTLDQKELELDGLKSKHSMQMQQFVPDEHKKEEEEDLTDQLVQLKFRLHELEESRELLQQQLKEKENEIEKLLVSTPSSPPPTDEDNPLPSSSSSSVTDTKKEDVYASMSSLLSPLVSRQMPDERLGLEKQVQRLSQMLHESEENVSALRNQEKILKDELRKMDAVEKRQDMNNEYLKNVLIKFLMSDNKQTLVPILSKLLYLDEAETNQLMANCI
ncbi:hypothetical protein A0J61_05737 [Choanephora cucurbitarum]|uniref:GRIP domain-containing protein n=1 Tax=Choanephora cucurbitarum TaxID=101091 RepID=A0A1C7NB35_9FUNG|nr:hypothetical protein A0J61_05737 [Choanephora cucurbitarum]